MANADQKGPAQALSTSPAPDKDDIASRIGDNEDDLARAFAKGWGRVTLGIVAAGGAYPVVLMTFSWCFGAYVLLFVERPAEFSQILQAVCVTIVYTFVSCFVGLAWAAVACVFVLPIVYLVVRSLGLRGSIVTFGAFCGGLVGFVAVLPVYVLLAMNEGFSHAGFFVWCAVAPTSATIAGQFGGAWGGRRAERTGEDWYRRQLAGATVFPQKAAEVDVVVTTPAQRSDDCGFRFSIRHLMWVAVWSSILLALIRLSGVPFEFMLPLFIGWLLFQLVTLKLGRSLLPRFASFWRSVRPRQTRST